VRNVACRVSVGSHRREIELAFLSEKGFFKLNNKTMKTAMQELRDDLVMTLKTGDEALNEIKDKSIRESCQKVVQLTLESIIKRIDEELLEMEKEQKIDFALTVYSEIVETDKDFVDVIKSMNL
jgi:hypothetical protein